jgi:hypothetical protein
VICHRRIQVIQQLSAGHHEPNLGSDPRACHVDVVCATLGGLGADKRRLSPDQRGLGALACRVGAVHRFALERLCILEFRLIGDWKLKHRSCVVELRLLDVPAPLAMIECLLTDVASGLLAIDSRLVIGKGTLLDVSWSAAVAQLILEDLFLINSRLLSVADQLLAFADCLLKIRQALLDGQFPFAFTRHARRSFAQVEAGAGNGLGRPRW